MVSPSSRLPASRSPRSNASDAWRLTSWASWNSDLGLHRRVRHPARGLVAGDDVDVDRQRRDVCSTRPGSSTYASSRVATLASPRAAMRGNLELEQHLAGLLGVEVAELDHDRAVADLLGGQVVVEPQELHRRLELHRQRQRLHDLVEQPVDLAGDRGTGGVGVVGEHVVAGAGPGDRGQQRLVVARGRSRAWR